MIRGDHIREDLLALIIDSDTVYFANSHTIRAEIGFALDRISLDMVHLRDDVKRSFIPTIESSMDFNADLLERIVRVYKRRKPTFKTLQTLSALIR